jgi:ABC-type polysaccharide/polyol phosphate export permease
MATIANELTAPRAPTTPAALGAVATLARRRFALTARTPRELIVPLLTPVLFALIIAPALKEALHTSSLYESFVATGTIGLLIPLNTMFAGLGAVVDREAGAQRELLTAPISRALLPIGNLIVAFSVTALQVAVLLAVATLRGIDFHIDGARVLWFVAGSALFAVGMYGIAEALAARVPRPEEYIARVPAIAIVPWFLAGSLFPISALPIGLEWITRFLPLTHALALVRYGLLGDSSGLQHIWRMSSVGEMATLSLAAVGLFAAVALFGGIRAFRRSAVQ